MNTVKFITLFFLLHIYESSAVPLTLINGDESSDFISNHLIFSHTANAGANPDNVNASDGFWLSAGDTATSVTSNTTLYSTFTFTVTGLGESESLNVTGLSFDYGRYVLNGSQPVLDLYVDTGNGYGDSIYNVSDDPSSSSVTEAHTAPLNITLSNGDSITFGFSFADIHSLRERTHLLSNLVLDGTFNSAPQEDIEFVSKLDALSLAILTGDTTAESITTHLSFNVTGETGISVYNSAADYGYWTSALNTTSEASNENIHTAFTFTAQGLLDTGTVDITGAVFDYLRYELVGAFPEVEVYIDSGEGYGDAVLVVNNNHIDSAIQGLEIPINLSLSNGESVKIGFSFRDLLSLEVRTHVIDNFDLKGFIDNGSESLGVDLNGNGVSDVWEYRYGATSLVNDDNAKGQDFDGDGATNYEESIAGTNPYDRSSNYRPVINSGGGQELSMSIPSVKGKRYKVLGSPSLLEDSWTVEMDAISADENMMDLLIDQGAEDRYFFRVEVDDVDEDGDGLTAYEEGNTDGLSDADDTMNDYERLKTAIKNQDIHGTITSSTHLIDEIDNTAVAITVTRSATSGNAVNLNSVLNLQISNLSDVASNAVSQDDYYLTDDAGNVIKNGIIVIDSGDISTTFYVNAVDDNIIESAEQLTLAIEGQAIYNIWIEDAETIPSSDFIAISQAGHFLSQATMGGTPETISELANQIKELGYIPACEAWIDDQFALPRESTITDDCFDFQDLHLAGLTVPSINIQNFELVWWGKMVQTNEQLRHRMAYTLSQVFVTSSALWANQERNNLWLSYTGYYDLLMDHAYSTHRDLLTAITYNPFMGVYLSFAQNKKADASLGTVPDENYAREVMQLFSCGVYSQDQEGNYLLNNSNRIENYDNDDILELSKVFTGLGLSNENGDLDNFLSPVISHGNRYIFPMQMNESYHDTTEKRLLDGTILNAGASGDDDISNALDRLAIHPSTAPHISRLLIKRLTNSNPSASYIGRVTEAWRGEGDYGNGSVGDFKSIIKAILLDPEARDATAYQVDESTDIVTVTPMDATGGRLKEPIIKWTQFYRFSQCISDQDGGKLYFQAKTKPASNDQTPDFGQIPMRAPSVFNYYDSDYSPSVGALADAGDSLNIRLTSPESEILSPYVIKQFETMNEIVAQDEPVSSSLYQSYSTGATYFIINYSYLAYLYQKNDNVGDFIDDLNLWLCNGQISKELKDELVWMANANRGATSENMGKVLSIIFNSSDFSVSY